MSLSVSKSEPERLKNALHKTLQSIPADATQRKRLSMIGATVLTHRQISACRKVVYRLGGFPLVRSTRTTISVNSRYPQNRSKVLKPKSEISQLPDTSTEIFYSGTIIGSKCPGFVDFVPGPGRLYYLSRMWARQ